MPALQNPKHGKMRGVAIAKVQFRGLRCCERMPAYNIRSTELFEYTEAFSPNHWRSYQEMLDKANARADQS